MKILTERKTKSDRKISAVSVQFYQFYTLSWLFEKVPVSTANIQLSLNTVKRKYSLVKVSWSSRSNFETDNLKGVFAYLFMKFTWKILIIPFYCSFLMSYVCSSAFLRLKTCIKQNLAISKDNTYFFMFNYPINQS